MQVRHHLRNFSNLIIELGLWKPFSYYEEQKMEKNQFLWLRNAKQI